MKGQVRWCVLASMMMGWSAHAQTVTYIHTDALGNKVATSDEQGNVTARFIYEPYGQSVGPRVLDAPGCAGHVQDSSTGLSYMQQRYFSPELGIFLSVDPVSPHGEKASQFNRYRYANSNPYSFTDPDGRVAVVTQMKDGSIKIDLHAKFTGNAATPERIASFKEQVAGMSGTYSVDGKETRVNVSVSDIDKKTPRPARNEIKLVEGETSNPTGRSFAELGGKRSEANVLDRFLSGVVPHEVGHLGGVDDQYDKRTGLPDPMRGNGIMNRVPGAVV
ncbi:RHS repeat-associated core domain-containing protein [Stenotrophomonas sp. SRS1]|uniref:RHS repeat-associated core domain-containing protein n=1 Tax=Stenotrophomonas sp. SRS1 TaxID=2870345 RepID=UPI002237CD3B|nr:RHS repeat-associated core domain-containing protein [Stenotrophomonas sp. SRS1]MCW6027775.1 RHS repeat-associated core domain-containing protein [Stenotrophomonas sp. SRS1]